MLEEKNDSVYIKLSVFLIIYICLISNLKISILSISAILLAFLFYEKPEYLLPSVLISSLLGDYFVAFAGMGMSRIMLLIYVFCSLLDGIKYRKKYDGNHMLIMMFACVFCFFSASMSLTGETKPAITMILNFIMLFFMASNYASDIKSLLTALKYGIWVFSFFIAYLVNTGRDVIYVSGRLTLVGANSNALGMCLAQIITFLLIILILENLNIHKIMDFICICLNIYALLLTGSRSSLIAIIIPILALAIYKLVEKGSLSKKLMFIALIGGFIFISYKMISKLDPLLLVRFTAEDVIQDGGTGRAEIWEAMLKYVIPQYLWFGVGFGGGNTICAMEPYVPRALGVHNLYITVLAQIGVIGSLIFYAFWIQCFTQIKKYIKEIPYIQIPAFMILTAFVNGIGEEIFVERFLWFSAGLIFMFIYNSYCGSKGEL